MESRSKKALLNSVVASLAQVITILFQFIARTFFIKILGEQYLGLNGLFTNVLGILNLAEMGIGSAITFSLYRPLAENNKPQIAAIMRYLQKWYRYIAVFVLVAGMIATPFIPHLIANNQHFTDFQVMAYFLVALSGTLVTYLLSYKRTLLIADQLGYINSLNTVYFNLATQLIQIIFLIFSRSFLIYLFIQVLMNLLSNIMISIKVDKRYTFLDNKTQAVPNEILKYFKRNMQGMIAAKLGGVVVNATDNLVLSAFLGLSLVAKYANYTLITTGLTAVLAQAISAVSSSIGNLAAKNESIDKQVKVFYEYFAITSIVSIAASIGFATFSKQFIDAWIGTGFVLPEYVVFLIVFNFYFQSVRQALIGYANSYGLYWPQRHKPIFEALINLLVSIALVKYFGLGIAGVMIGTISSNVLVNYWWEPLVVFKYGLKVPMGLFLYKYLLILVLGAVVIMESIVIGYSTSSLMQSLLLSLVLVLAGAVVFALIFKCMGINLWKRIKR